MKKLPININADLYFSDFESDNNFSKYYFALTDGVIPSAVRMQYLDAEAVKHLLANERFELVFENIIDKSVDKGFSLKEDEEDEGEEDEGEEDDNIDSVHRLVRKLGRASTPNELFYLKDSVGIGLFYFRKLQSKGKEKNVCSAVVLYNIENPPITLIDRCRALVNSDIVNTGKIHFVSTAGGGGFYLKDKKIKRNKEIDLELHYTKEFLPIDKNIKEFLNSDDTGLVILEGEVGTGKTSFLRYLLNHINKRVIYLPPHLVQSVGNPEFLGFLLNYNDFVLILEDAEDIVMKREANYSSGAVSNLLNISDGLIGDGLKSKIICTFNVDIKEIDPALLRKGRLKVEWEFKKLEPENANKLLLKLYGPDTTTSAPMSLAEIYNLKRENRFRKEEEKRVGFKL